ncbi:MAG: tRNA uridine(34) 5-carboxymethylaminomethyl modification radical SAM/GNAT enzyme Elp3 [Candidatus Bathyarchaeota archaeon]|nr:tRNA uridine(34) 5-carboxymethylaminomethyl modification radical SAM/GNAT enzyme Elp3 [Candidatus Bathyarchaeota archaeon]
METSLRLIVERLLAIPSPDRGDVERVKIEVSREHRLPGIPGNAEVIASLNPEERARLIHVLRRKETRALSGVNVVAVMTEPRACPHGRCAYCPGGPDDGVPQSYTGHEPASMRGAQNEYDPFKQATSRIEQLRAIGHEVDKVDLIVMGGTFPASPPEYQESFIHGCLDALNERRSPTLTEAKSFAEGAAIRNVGITVETRPDSLNPAEVDRLLGLGVTRVELGVQNVYDDIYELVERGHTVQDVIDATRLLKDSGLKVCYHMMPGLPGSSPERDLDGFREIFDNPAFKPDMIKIYPTLVLEGTKIHEWWKDGSYAPLTTEQAVKLVAEMKEYVPPWTRIMRVGRDIPSTIIEAGVDKTNLRQLVHDELAKRGKRCNCIRCREVGHRDGRDPAPENLEVRRRTYEASGGVEHFISVEEVKGDTLVGFIRLRIPSDSPHRPEAEPSSAFVRELHVYGPMVPVGSRLDSGWQHMGWGKRLLEEAEKVAFEEHGVEKLLVMSALGTKEYYAKLGYGRDGVYVSKRLPGGNI